MPQTLLSAAQILAAEDLSHEDHEVPEWGGTVRLQQMSAEESMAFTKELKEVNAAAGEGQNLGMFLMLVHSARYLDGKRIFTVADLPGLKRKSIDVLNRLQRITLKLNKMGFVEEVVLKKA